MWSTIKSLFNVSDYNQYTVYDSGKDLPSENKVECPFKVGDVVKLASGGPAMTVVDTEDSDVLGVMVTWFESNVYLRTEFVSEGGLVKVNKDAASQKTDATTSKPAVAKKPVVKKK